MQKTLYVRSFDQDLHKKLEEFAKEQGIKPGTMVEDALEKWIKQKKVVPRKHYAIIYSDKESLIDFMQKIQNNTKDSEWSHVCLGPDEHFALKYLKKHDWLDASIKPYNPTKKSDYEYPKKVFDKLKAMSKKKKTMFMGFMTEDFAHEKSLNIANKVEKIYNTKRALGVTFCPYRMDDVMSAPMSDIFELIEDHDKTMILKDGKVYEWNFKEENTFKLLV
jgi:hypothetical protein